MAEERAYVQGGWRLRLVDDLTESFVNGATGADYKQRSQGLDTMRSLILYVYLCGVMLTMWKADVRSVFKKLVTFYIFEFTFTSSCPLSKSLSTA